MSNLGQGYWECLRVEGTHTRDKGEKIKICHSIPASSLIPVFSSQCCWRFIRVKLNLNGVNQWSVEQAVWFFLSVAAQLLCCTRDHSCSRPQTHTE